MEHKNSKRNLEKVSSEGIVDETYCDEVISEMTAMSASKVLDMIIHRNMAPDAFRKSIYDFVLKAVTLDKAGQGILSPLVPALLNLLKDFDDRAPLLFLLLENLRNKKEEDLRIRILEMLEDSSFTTSSVVGLLYKSEVSDLIIEILGTQHHDFTDDFIRSSLKLTDTNVLKNLSQILPRFSAKHFINYNSFMFMSENEHYAIRCCLLDIIENLIVFFKEQNNVESIRELLEHIKEHLNDVNFYVRGRALGCIANLFRQECILKDQRNSLVREIIGRVKDRTVIVRKKSVNILSQILINHPFRDRENLERVDGTCSNTMEVVGSKCQMEEDFDEFVGLMELALNAVEMLLEYDLKTDAIEIVNFIKVSYILKIRGAEQALRRILGLVFTKDKQVVIDAFREITGVRMEAIYEFIDDRAFDEILKHVNLDDKMLFKNFYSGHMALESSYILSKLPIKISEENGLVLLSHATSILFGSRDAEDLTGNNAMYGHVLEILMRMKGRIQHSSEILRIASKNIIKMLFFEYSLIKSTIQLFYVISLNPEKNCLKLLKNLCLCKSTLKILDCVGWIAISQYYLFERLEHNLKGQDSKKSIVIEGVGAEKLDEFRRSLGREGLAILREKRKSLEETRRLSLGATAKMSLRFDSLTETLRDKTDEEVADFFFFLREKEVLYSETSLLHQFVPLIIDSCSSSSVQIQIIAYLTLNRLMLTSSVFFNENFELFRNSLFHEHPTVKNNAIIALHDFVILYGSSFDTSLVFNCLDDSTINKNTALIIHSLLNKNVIRIRNNGVRLMSYLFDSGIGVIVADIIKKLSTSNNVMSILFYETFLSTLNIEHLEYLCNFISPSIHESLFLKCLSSGGSADRIKCLYKNLTISDKFIEEHSYREDVKVLLESMSCTVK
ncbi:hypothetical protein PAEPH01_0944 [Pancytospora epiphaga]|nr:hypothetical protein PAEPH01_0944 [Pancytospora epiphaga]